MRPRWMFAAGALLALAAEPAAARLVREPAGPGPATTPASAPVQTGGQPLGPGRSLAPCTSPGAALSMVAWLSFQNPEIIPCVLQPGQDYLQGAAALRLAIIQGRLLQSGLTGPRVTCRNFVDTLRIRPRTPYLRGGTGG